MMKEMLEAINALGIKDVRYNATVMSGAVLRLKSGNSEVSLSRDGLMIHACDALKHPCIAKLAELQQMNEKHPYLGNDHHDLYKAIADAFSAANVKEDASND